MEYKGSSWTDQGGKGVTNSKIYSDDTASFSQESALGSWILEVYQTHGLPEVISKTHQYYH